MDEKKRVEQALQQLKGTKFKTLKVKRVLVGISEIAAEVAIGSRTIGITISFTDLRRFNESDLDAYLANELQQQRPNKYNATRVQEDGYTFASKAEHRRYLSLKWQVAAGAITDLEVHPVFVLAKKTRQGQEVLPAIKHIPDFSYTEGGQLVVEDVKGVRLREWKTKYNLFRRHYTEIIYRVVDARHV